jgi:SAM-dependent methyltransferase
MEGPFARGVKGLARRLHLGDPLTIGDFVKSWDVLTSIEFLQERSETSDPILDLGCYASEILLALDKAGYGNLSGIDLNPRLKEMPRQGRIHYRTGDFMQTPFADQSFAAITSISVIEHGFDGPRLMGEASRLLQPGGVFVASFDYWPEKIDTSGTRFFGMDWLIFSRADVEAMVDEAARHGLRPVGAMDYDAAERTIRFGGYAYTFAWLALEKRL